MATRTKAEQLDLGVPIDAPAPDTSAPEYDPDVAAYTDAFYTTLLGRRVTPTGVGFYFTRIARTVTGATVTASSHEAALPGPVLNVQATTASSTGPKTVVVTGTPSAGQVRIDTGAADGRDTLVFAAADAVTVCAYRQQAMPQEMYDALIADTDPPIEA